MKKSDDQNRGWENPSGSSWWDPQNFLEAAEGLSRRAFMKLAGASMALAGLAGCRRPIEKIVPYLSTPEEVVLGMPNYYATAMPFGLDAQGLVVECHEGRPTKIEGNPLHPSTLGGSNVFMQAAILELYDPDRSRQVLHNGAASSWAEFVEFWRGLEAGYLSSGGAGLAVLSESFSSPTLARLKEQFQQRFPQAFWATYEPISDENIFAGIKAATGQDLRPVYHFDKADVILSLDADFLGTESGSVRYSRDFATRRRVSSPKDSMNRLYVVESAYSLTGAMADHRLTLASSSIGGLTALLALELATYGYTVLSRASIQTYLEQISIWLNDGGDASPLPDFQQPSHRWSDYFDLPDDAKKFARVLAEDVTANGGRVLTIAGRRQPPAVHVLALAMNVALGNIGNTIAFSESKDTVLPNRASLAELTDRMSTGEISTLVMLGGNPVYNAPVDLEFKSALAKVPNSIHLSLHEDETSGASHWHINQAHFLESWGDARSLDGTLSVIQPMIAPLHGGRSSVEVLNLIATGADQPGYEIVRQTWEAQVIPERFEESWREILHDGILAGSALAEVPITIDEKALSEYLAANPLRQSAELELVFLPDAKVWDGRFANNGWLQELPDPVTKLTWDNAALISHSLALERGLRNGDLIRLKYRDRAIEIPVWVQPGMAEKMIAIPLGYGRSAAGAVGNGVGANAFLLRYSDNPDFCSGVTIEKLGMKHRFATTQKTRSQMGRPLIREASLEDYRFQPDFAQKMVEVPAGQSLWVEHQYIEGYQWGMAIDLNICTGCSACVIACQAENNIPIVGKKQVSKGREMHWLRVDAYYNGSDDDPRMVVQPMPCQHCEMAPCESVCPVFATSHDSEGLNVMTYNRCVGTRYCSNNCPYKVRRFNFFLYTGKYPELVKMARNPDVTVRSRGVMEKCSYCLQRINRGKYQAKREGRPVRDGDIVPACQQACPTGAIVFGNIRDLESRVAAGKKQERNYAILAEFNTRPRTTYLARLRNPNSRINT